MVELSLILIWKFIPWHALTTLELFSTGTLPTVIVTAQIIKNQIPSLKDIDILTNPLFIEREFGSAENQPITPENYKKVIEETFVGMEKGKDLCKRTLDGVYEILEKYPNKNILVVCHSHVIKSIFMQFDENVHFDTKFGHHNINILKFNGNKILDCKFNICL